LLAIAPLDNLTPSQANLGIGTAVTQPRSVPPAVGVFRPSTDWAGITAGGVGELGL